MAEYSEAFAIFKPLGIAECRSLAAVADRLVAAEQTTDERRRCIEELAACKNEDSLPFFIRQISLRYDPFKLDIELSERFRVGNTMNADLVDEFVASSIKSDPQKGIERVLEIHNKAFKTQVLRRFVETWLNGDPMAASSIVGYLEDTGDVRLATELVIKHLVAHGNTAEAENWKRYLLTVDN